MQDGFGQIPVLVSCFENPIREIDVFAIHKEVFVEQSDLVEHRSANHHKGSADDFNLCSFFPWQVAHVVLSELSVFGKTVAESCHFIEGHDRRGQSASRLHGIASIGAQHSHAKSSGLGSFVEKAECILDGVFSNEGIRVQQQHILAFALSDGNVVGSGKALVVNAFNKVHPVEALAKKLHRVVFRVVVNHEYFSINTI